MKTNRDSWKIRSDLNKVQIMRDTVVELLREYSLAAKAGQYSDVSWITTYLSRALNNFRDLEQSLTAEFYVTIDYELEKGKKDTEEGDKDETVDM